MQGVEHQLIAVAIQIDLNECHIPKAVHDYGGMSYMRPDLIRLLVDTRRKEFITEADGSASIVSYSTRERLRLNDPLDEKPLSKEERGKKVEVAPMKYEHAVKPASSKLEMMRNGAPLAT